MTDCVNEGVFEFIWQGCVCQKHLGATALHHQATLLLRTLFIFCLFPLSIVYCEELLTVELPYLFVGKLLTLCQPYRITSNFSLLALNLKVNVIPHQTQQTTNFVDGPDAAKEAHGHWQGTHSDKDVGSHFHCVWRLLWRKQKKKNTGRVQSTHNHWNLCVLQIYLTPAVAAF